jgi:hypothetical protein
METLLQRFIRDEVKSYVEPTRKGTPRGEPIGLSKVKHRAAVLVSTTSKPLFEIAREVGVSHGLLRKWTCEDVFKDAIKRLRREFVGLVQEYLLERLRAIQQVSDDDRRRAVVAAAKEGPGEVHIPAFADLSAIRDCQLYSVSVKKMLAAWAMKKDPAISVALLVGMAREEKWLEYERGILISLIKGHIETLLSGEGEWGDRLRSEVAMTLHLVGSHLERLGD